jgi:hypothetical protein
LSRSYGTETCPLLPLRSAAGATMTIQQYL